MLLILESRDEKLESDSDSEALKLIGSSSSNSVLCNRDGEPMEFGVCGRR